MSIAIAQPARTSESLLVQSNEPRYIAFQPPSPRRRETITTPAHRQTLAETHGEPRFEFGRFLQGTGAIEDDSGTDNEIRRRISMSVPRLLRSPFAWCVTYRCPAAICRLFLSSNRVFL